MTRPLFHFVCQVLACQLWQLTVLNRNTAALSSQWTLHYLNQCLMNLAEIVWERHAEGQAICSEWPFIALKIHKIFLLFFYCEPT